ncbi:aldo/keto reductase [Candidatus Sumerlaeota bacterium]|nr:aldo/keto reductase [Candidatus Sumerlaeota bacterium]
MEYRRFGRTELQMPVFSTGGMRYQHQWQDLPMEEVSREGQANLEAIIRCSLELGINHIETARGYGSSERQLGQILPDLPREQLIVQTKVSPESDVGRFRDNFHDSLARLNLDYVDLFAIHGINNEETLQWSLGPDGCLKAARDFVKQGLARHIGFSTHGSTDVIVRAIQAEEHGGFDYVNLHWFYIFQDNWPAVLEARKQDMGVFIISPSDKGGMLYKPSDKLREITSPLHPIVFNDLFCLSFPEIHTLSIGVARPSDYDEHIEAVEQLDQAVELVPPIAERMEGVMYETVGREFAERYAEGIPRWEEVPGGINIRIILWLYNLARAYDMVEYGRMRYNLLGNGGHWFPGFNMAKAVEEKISLTPALAQSPFKDEIPRLLDEAHALLWSKPEKRLSESG